MTNKEMALHLAKLAMPLNDDDWGSERQIDAENKLYSFIEQHYPTLIDHEFEMWALKASANERIYELMVRISELK